MRMRIESGRSRTRTSVRVIVAVTLLMAGGLVLLNREYLSPYDTALGQFILLAVGGCFGGAFAWLSHMARPMAGQRLLVRRADPEALV